MRRLTAELTATSSLFPTVPSGGGCAIESSRQPSSSSILGPHPELLSRETMTS